VFYILSTSLELSCTICTLHHIYAGSYLRVIGFTPKQSIIWNLSYLNLLLTQKWLLHFIKLVSYNSIWPSLLLDSSYLMGFPSHKKVGLNRRLCLVVRITLHFFIIIIAKASIHSFVIHLIHAIIAIILHYTVRKRGAKSAHAKDSLVQNTKEP
jgi:hypothetical protein